MHTKIAFLHTNSFKIKIGLSILISLSLPLSLPHLSRSSRHRIQHLDVGKCWKGLVNISPFFISFQWVWCGALKSPEPCSMNASIELSRTRQVAPRTWQRYVPVIVWFCLKGLKPKFISSIHYKKIMPFFTFYLPTLPSSPFHCGN